ncbi:MAG: hypothetical protein JSU01_14575 [Bacteroidetes bacterium]|nr:hypothetical protein [Bacteroidota bacterium]
MTPRTLLALIIKTVGIYLITSALIFLPQAFGVVLETLSMGNGSFSFNNAMEFICFFVLTIWAYILIFKYCLVRTDWVIDKLHLDRGFAEEKIEINIHRSTVLRIAVIVIGMVVMIDSLPLFIKQVIAYMQMDNHSGAFGTRSLSAGWLTYYFIKFVFGFFLVTSSRLVVNFIELKRKKPIEETEE